MIYRIDKETTKLLNKNSQLLSRILEIKYNLKNSIEDTVSISEVNEIEKELIIVKMLLNIKFNLLKTLGVE